MNRFLSGLRQLPLRLMTTGLPDQMCEKADEIFGCQRGPCNDFEM